MEFLRRWIFQGPPRPFWLPGCFCPRAVCTALLQQFARHQGLSIEGVEFHFKVLPEAECERREELERQKDEGSAHPSVSDAAFGCDVVGLYLHGASWSEEEEVFRMLHRVDAEAALPVPRRRFSFKRIVASLLRCWLSKTTGNSTRRCLSSVCNPQCPVRHLTCRTAISARSSELRDAPAPTARPVTSFLFPERRMQWSYANQPYRTPVQTRRLQPGASALHLLRSIHKLCLHRASSDG